MQDLTQAKKKYTGEREQKPHMPDDHNKDWMSFNVCFRRVIGYEEK